MAIPTNPKFWADVVAEFGANSFPVNEEQMFAGCYNKVFGSYPAGSQLGDFEGLGQPSFGSRSATNVDTDSATLNGTVYVGGRSTEYRFEYKKATSSTWTTLSWNTITVDSSVSVNISGLVAGSDYNFRLVAHNVFNNGSSADWNYSGTSTFTTDNPTVNPPQDLFAVDNRQFGMGVDLSWSDPITGNPDSYELQYYDGQWNLEASSISGTANSYTDSDASGSVTQYRIKAVENGYSSDWNYSNTI